MRLNQTKWKSRDKFFEISRDVWGAAFINIHTVRKYQFSWWGGNWAWYSHRYVARTLIEVTSGIQLDRTAWKSFTNWWNPSQYCFKNSSFPNRFRIIREPASKQASPWRGVRLAPGKHRWLGGGSGGSAVGCGRSAIGCVGRFSVMWTRIQKKIVKMWTKYRYCGNFLKGNIAKSERELLKKNLKNLKTTYIDVKPCREFKKRT